MRVVPPDLLLWLTGHVRELAAADGYDADVADAEPDDLGATLPLERPVIVLRDDGGPRLDLTTFDRSIGASVLGASKLNPKPANDLARWLAGVLFDLSIPLAHGSPIVRVEPSGCNGPYRVPEQLDVARLYLTAQYVVTGSW